MMTEHSWQPESAETIHDRVAALIAGLRALGMLKPGEQAVTSHQHGCPAGRPPYPDDCRCAGGPELQYADWDELRPVRHYTIPERFYARH